MNGPEPVELPEHIKHGTFTAWQAYKCKCDLCRSHWRSTQKKYRGQRRDFLFSEVPHGLKGYNYYGCRCDTCCDARRSYDRNRWEAKQRAQEITPERREAKRLYDRQRNRVMTEEQRLRKQAYDRAYRLRRKGKQ